MVFQEHGASGSKCSNKLPSWNKLIQIPWAPQFIKKVTEAGWKELADHSLACNKTERALLTMVCHVVSVEEGARGAGGYSQQEEQ